MLTLEASTVASPEAAIQPTIEQIYEDGLRIAKLASPKGFTGSGENVLPLTGSLAPETDESADVKLVMANAGGLSIGYGNNTYDGIEAYFKPGTEVNSESPAGFLYFMNGKRQARFVFGQGMIKTTQQLENGRWTGETELSPGKYRGLWAAITDAIRQLEARKAADLALEAA